MTGRTIVVVGAHPSSLYNLRRELIRRLAASGDRIVALASTSATASEQAAVEALGVAFRAYPVARSSLDPRGDLATCRALRRIFQELRPDVVIAYTIKPVIWSGIALRGMHGPTFFALVTGLGYAFSGSGFWRWMLRTAATALYRRSLARAEGVIFQNVDNRDEFVRRCIVPAVKCHVVSGSGVDVERFSVVPLPEGPPVFLVIARLLGEKGLREYAKAASVVRQLRPDATFRLVGPPDPSPDGIQLGEVEEWQRQGHIHYFGGTDDVRPHVAGCHVFVLPSYHEGLPRTVLEAMSMGRPILTTDVPGCRETVVQGKNGYLVPKADHQALAERMLWFIDNRHQWSRMSAASRQMAVQRFDVHRVNTDMLRIMGLDGSGGQIR